MKKWGKRRTKRILFEMIFRKRPLSSWKIKKRTRGELVTAATIDVRVFFFLFFCEKCSKMKKSFFFKSTPTLTPGIAHVAPWPRGRVVGVCPSARPPFHHSFSLFVCPYLSSSQSLTLSFASLSAPAARRSFTAAVRPLREA